MAAVEGGSHVRRNGFPGGNPEACLADCGCCEQTVQEYLACGAENRTADQLRLLQQHRRVLMDSLHLAQRRVDAVDFLICSLEQSLKS